jgi:succinate dehydrogenase/fumarate reductase flavoprotein subunit
MDETQMFLTNWAGQNEGGLRPFQVRERLQKVMWEKCGVERDDPGLRQGLEELRKLEKEDCPRIKNSGFPRRDSYGAYPQEIQEALEVRMMILVGQLVLGSALLRKETRGHHIRTDYPDSSREPKHTFLTKGKGLWEGEVKKVRSF